MLNRQRALTLSRPNCGSRCHQLHVYLTLRFLRRRARGIRAVLDKASGKNYSFTHELMQYTSARNPMAAYDFQPAGHAVQVRNGSALLAATVSLGAVLGC